MEITEVRVKLIDDSSERLRAFCSITFDNCFVIRDLKIIDGSNGLFVAMPSRKLTIHCPQCRCKNHARATYCNQCGARLTPQRPVPDETGRTKLYADIAHPINSECRDLIQQRVIEAFEQEKILSLKPGYVCRYEDLDDCCDVHSKVPESVKDYNRRLDCRQSARPPHWDCAPTECDSASSTDDDQFGAGVF